MDLNMECTKRTLYALAHIEILITPTNLEKYTENTCLVISHNAHAQCRTQIQILHLCNKKRRRVMEECSLMLYLLIM